MCGKGMPCRVEISTTGLKGTNAASFVWKLMEKFSIEKKKGLE